MYSQNCTKCSNLALRVGPHTTDFVSSSAGAAQAMGRVVGSLSVVTCKDGDAESAMLASWLSQASFDPPGLTVAVKRDRATESLMVRIWPRRSMW